MLSDVKKLEKIKETFIAIKKHPFTIISLADREKFHTGMLAFLLNECDKKGRLKLIQALWGEENCVDADLNDKSNLRCFVEEKSIDLVIKDCDKNVKLWAEMKFKTTLSQGQLDKYIKDHPKSAGALFALFTDVENLPQLPNNTKFREIAFHVVIIDFIKKNSLCELIPNSESDQQKDKITLIRLWLEYLELIRKLTKHTIDAKLNAIGGDFAKQLGKIKLKGIFEHYRHSLFRKEVEKLAIGRGNSEILKHFRVNQFNSRGNSGIEYVIHPYGDIEVAGKSKNTKKLVKDCHMSYGLQWQDKSLKLFITTESLTAYTEDRLKRYQPLKKQDIFKNRDAKLGALYKKFEEIDWGDNKKLVRKNSKRSDKEDSLFKSYTIEEWDIFEPKLRSDDPIVSSADPSLADIAESLWCRLRYLASTEFRDLVLEQGILE